MSHYYGISTGRTAPAPAISAPLVEATVDAYVSAPGLTIAAPGSQTVALVSTVTDSYVLDVPITTVPFQSQEVTLVATIADAYVSDPTLTLGAIGSITTSFKLAMADAYVSAPEITVAGVGSQTVNMVSGIADAYVSPIAMSVEVPGSLTASLTPMAVDGYVSSPTISTTPLGDVELDLVGVIADAYVSAPTITTEAVGSQSVSLTSTAVDAYVLSPAITTNVPGALSLPLVSVIADAYVSAPTITTDAPGSQTVSATSAAVDAYVLSPAISSEPPGAATVAMVSVTADGYVSNPALTTQAPGSTEVAFSAATVDAYVNNVGMTIEDPAPGPNMAACQTAQGWMYSNAFSAYNLLDYNGYLSVWYKANQPIPSWAEIDHKQVIFQAMNSQEDHVEMGIGRYGNTLYPDMYISRNDNRDQSELWTRLEEDEDLDGKTVPDLFDGEWHHLVFGYEGPGVTGADGWYFWIDDQRYGTTRFEWSSGTQTEDWFRGVQENTPNDFTELNVGFNHLVGPLPPGGQNLNENIFGCLDEMLVVNTRTIGDRGGTAGEVDDDVAYLYNQGLGRLVEQVESDNQDGLWDDVYNAWKFESDGIGNEYKNPSGTGAHNLPNNGNLNSAAGIPGSGFTSVSADFGSDLVVLNPTPYLYSPYIFDGPMSIPNYAMSLVVWFKPANVTPSGIYPTLASQSGAGAGEWALYREPTGSWVFETRSSFGTRYCRISGIQAMDTSKWYMIVATATLDFSRLHIWWEDGTPQYLTNFLAMGTINRNTGSPFRLGTWSASNNPSQGWIDDVLYFNYELPNLGSSASAQWLFNDGPGRSLGNIKSNDMTFYNTIASHWNLNQTGSGTQARPDDADGTDSALSVYGSSAGLIANGSIGTGPGHILD